MNYEYYKKYCKDIENVENYEKALADNFKGWIVHHRLETHNSDGERRVVNITSSELVALDMYWDRPAEELIFMTSNEHKSLHWKGNQHNKGKLKSEETKRKHSLALKGKPKSEEHRKKISIAKKGKCQSEEHRRKNSEGHKGQLAWNKGKKMSEDFKKKVSENTKGKRWYTNGEIEIKAKECPEGFTPGRLRK